MLVYPPLGAVVSRKRTVFYKAFFVFLCCTLLGSAAISDPLPTHATFSAILDDGLVITCPDEPHLKETGWNQCVYVVDGVEFDPQIDHTHDLEQLSYTPSGDIVISYIDEIAVGITKSGPSSRNPGDNIVYNITVQNSGIATANNVIVTDYLPNDTDNYEYISSVPEGDYDPNANTITWNFDQLGSDDIVINVTLRAGIEGGDGPGFDDLPYHEEEYYITNESVELSNFATVEADETTEPVGSSTVTTTINQDCSFSLFQPPTGYIKSATGHTFTYLLSITNTGNIYQQFDLSNIDNVEGTEQELDSYIETTDGDQLERTPFLAPGETYYFHLRFETPGGTQPNGFNYADLTATPTICGDPITNTIETFVYGGQPPDEGEYVSINKTADRDPVPAGEELTYTIHIINPEEDPIQDAIVTEEYPENTTFVSATPPPDEGDNIWQISPLEAETTHIIEVTVEVDNDLPDGTILYNTVFIGVESDPEEPDEIYDAFTLETLVSSAPDLEIIKTANVLDTPARPGSIVEYTVSYTNNGNRTAPNVIITDDYDGQYMEIEDAGLGNTDVPGEITWEVGDLAPGEVKSLTYTMRILDEEGLFPSGVTEICNHIWIESGLEDANPEDNHSEACIQVTNRIDLKAEKTISPDPPSLCGPIIYDITITNVGELDHMGEYIVTDYLPDGTTYLESSQPEGYPPAVYDATDHTVTWETDNHLPAGASRTFSIILDQPDCEMQGDTISNLVTVYSVSFIDQNPADNEFTLKRQIEYSPVVVDGPPDTEFELSLDHTEDEIDQAFEDWRSNFTVTEEGCGITAQTDLENIPYPSCDNLIVTVVFTAEDICSADTHTATFTLIPQSEIDLPDPGPLCVEDIWAATYAGGAYPFGDIDPNRPDYYRLYEGDPLLDIGFNYACPPGDDPSESISWEIDFYMNEEVNLQGTGQISERGDDIDFPMDYPYSVQEHLITYTVTDHFGNQYTRELIVEVHPRPDIQDNL